MLSEPKVLILVSRDFGELTNALTFARSPGLRVTLLVPENLYETLSDEQVIVRRLYRNTGEVRSAVRTERPDVLMLFSGYLLVLNRLFDFPAFESFLQELRSNQTLVLTSDPFLGLLRAQGPEDLGTTHPAAKWLLQHLRRAAVSLSDIPHVYAVPCAEFHGAGKIAYRLPLEAEREHSASGRALRLRESQCPLEEDQFWLFVLSGEDHRIQIDRWGADAFVGLLAARMSDAHEAGRLPVLIAPTACVEALLAVLQPSVRHWALPFCGYRLFEDLVLGAEHVFYWNQASNSILLRLANGLPFWSFDQGHLLRMLPALRAIALKCLHDDSRMHELDLAALMTIGDLTRRCDATQRARSAQAFRCQALNHPADVIRRCLAQRMLMETCEPSTLADSKE